MSGGIIIQRAQILLDAIKEPCLHDGLPKHIRDRIAAIDSKQPDQRTEDDVHYLGACFPLATHC